jgi:hypothetical protein
MVQSGKVSELDTGFSPASPQLIGSCWPIFLKLLPMTENGNVNDSDEAQDKKVWPGNAFRATLFLSGEISRQFQS